MHPCSYDNNCVTETLRKNQAKIIYFKTGIQSNIHFGGFPHKLLQAATFGACLLSQIYRHKSPLNAGFKQTGDLFLARSVRFVQQHRVAVCVCFTLYWQQSLLADNSHSFWSLVLPLQFSKRQPVVHMTHTRSHNTPAPEEGKLFGKRSLWWPLEVSGHTTHTVCSILPPHRLQPVWDERSWGCVRGSLRSIPPSLALVLLLGLIITLHKLLCKDS